MRTIDIHTQRPYRVHIGAGLIEKAGTFLAPTLRGKKCAIVSDYTVAALYREKLECALLASDIECYVFTVPAGEASKSIENWESLLAFLAENGFTREDGICALGGGVVGDLAGFAAATYLRGVPFFQVPASLLAMVDASVGGKTAVNLSNGKNTVGAFYQPHAVVCDTDLLSTLPEDNFREACAEIIKYFVLGSSVLSEELKKGLNFDRERVIAECIRIKEKYIRDDETDFAGRRLLNLGHTVGHAIEVCSGYTVSHGNAVAIGLATAVRAAKKQKICTSDDANRILALLKDFSLPTETEYEVNEIFGAVFADKKRTDECFYCIIPHKIGDCRVVPLDFLQMRRFLEDGLC